MQADGRMVASGQLVAPRYKGLADAFTTIAQSEGVAGAIAPRALNVCV